MRKLIIVFGLLLLSLAPRWSMLGAQSASAQQCSDCEEATSPHPTLCYLCNGQQGMPPPQCDECFYCYLTGGEGYEDCDEVYDCWFDDEENLICGQYCDGGTIPCSSPLSPCWFAANGIQLRVPKALLATLGYEHEEKVQFETGPPASLGLVHFASAPLWAIGSRRRGLFGSSQLTA